MHLISDVHLPDETQQHLESLLRRWVRHNNEALVSILRYEPFQRVTPAFLDELVAVVYNHFSNLVVMVARRALLELGKGVYVYRVGFGKPTIAHLACVWLSAY